MSKLHADEIELFRKELTASYDPSTHPLPKIVSSELARANTQRIRWPLCITGDLSVTEWIGKAFSNALEVPYFEAEGLFRDIESARMLGHEDRADEDDGELGVEPAEARVDTRHDAQASNRPEPKEVHVRKLHADPIQA